MIEYDGPKKHGGMRGKPPGDETYDGPPRDMTEAPGEPGEYDQSLAKIAAGAKLLIGAILPAEWSGVGDETVATCVRVAFDVWDYQRSADEGRRDAAERRRLCGPPPGGVSGPPAEADDLERLLRASRSAIKTPPGPGLNQIGFGKCMGLFADMTLEQRIEFCGLMFD